MKQKIFTLVLMLAMVFVASSAWALNEKTVFQGGEYSYKLNGISSITAATISISITDPTNITISAPTPTSIAANSIDQSIEFDIDFGTEPDFASTGNHTLTVLINNGTCSNSINYIINVVLPPTYTIAMTETLGTFTSCQARTGAGDNTPDVTVATNDESNSFTFTVTPTITGAVAPFTYTYALSLPNAATTNLNGYSISCPTATISGGVVTHALTTGQTPAADVFTITFYTTTNLAQQDITGLITLGANTDMVLSTDQGGGTYAATQTAGGVLTQSVTVNEVPAIGSFGN